jgi:diguanylate cyclase (GGDEF)-like protein
MRTRGLNNEALMLGPPALAEQRGASGVAEDRLNQALLDSRQRWQAFVAMAADFAYETDAEGRFVFLSPDVVLGWSADSLLSCPASLLLASPGIGFNPFAPGMAARGQRVWLRRADGMMVCYAFACTPLDHSGATGSRGLAQDITAQDTREAAVAAALRRIEVMDHILWRMRQEVLAASMMQAVLDALITAMGAQGAAVVNLLTEPGLDAVLHEAGTGMPDILPAIQAMVQPDMPDTQAGYTPDGRALAACPSLTRFGERAALAIWRPPAGRSWDADDVLLISSATAIIRIVLEHDSIQRELARQARTDPLTGLLNRRSFIEEMHRRIERLDREGLPGTLMFIDLDFFKALNDACGHEVGDEALTLAAQLLRDTVRPADLVARLGGDEFALWLDGSDELTAAERGERLRLGAPSYFARELPAGAPNLSMSIGIASRRAGDGEDLEVLIRRADSAMYDVKRNGRGHWKVARDGFFP